MYQQRQREAKYHFSPTLLDSFSHYLSADSDWEKYYGDSAEPSITLADYQQKCYDELMNRINHIRTSSADMAKGTAFNDVVDTLIHGKVCGHTKMERIYAGNGEVCGIRAIVNDEDKTYSFDFALDFCKNAAAYFADCHSQLRVDGVIDTEFGDVHLLGYIDELRKDVVYDIKTCNKYEPCKYKAYNQRFVYPYCLIESGMMDNVKEFEFTAFKLTGGNSRTALISGEKFSEVYVYNHEEAKSEIREICELFIAFIEANRDKITNQSIFIYR